ncbi:protein DCL homolog, chloroplastic-like [Coffea eugenioides]|uniref:Protein DCL homolog, chloroplastic-like n=1 Tax=Coffea arabica TaxID=13443 RepID=A0A6P6UR27_COFAR|nr:protein DCL homolog, chloroplastic-like [Coffea arabica]XP_027092968.1 protein DCL homolog, chloroplastic-like [Coffea arabica]XP_027148825.1 protein DCL homolog, chloroplastic-like [Coffea eugenioides]XP_027176100.1 protein DCL homolog, chloroplastic-like [Coffea eugenioides]
MAAPLLRGLPLLRHRLHLHRRRLTLGSLSLRPWFTSVESIPPDDKTGPSTTTQTTTIPGLSARDSVANPRRSWDDPDYRKWKDKEAEILEDIEPVISLAKEIIHSNRYMDGERLTAEDEKTVIERLLAYHPHSEDKIGCGLDSIMVDRHPQFRHSRCLFVVRTDGGWIDFSYQKCLRAYIRDKYPSHAERFIKGHFKRSSS